MWDAKKNGYWRQSIFQIYLIDNITKVSSFPIDENSWAMAEACLGLPTLLLNPRIWPVSADLGLWCLGYRTIKLWCRCLARAGARSLGCFSPNHFTHQYCTTMHYQRSQGSNVIHSVQLLPQHFLFLIPSGRAWESNACCLHYCMCISGFPCCILWKRQERWASLIFVQ